METTEAFLPSAIQRLPQSRVTKNEPRKTMLAMASKARGDRSSVRLMKLPAALLTRPVSAPPSAQTVSIISAIASGTRMSQAMPIDLAAVRRRVSSLARRLDHPAAPAADIDLGAQHQAGLGHHLAQARAAAGDQDALALHQAGRNIRSSGVMAFSSDWPATGRVLTEQNQPLASCKAEIPTVRNSDELRAPHDEGSNDDPPAHPGSRAFAGGRPRVDRSQRATWSASARSRPRRIRISSASPKR